jgi:hypothetical protein
LMNPQEQCLVSALFVIVCVLGEKYTCQESICVLFGVVFGRKYILFLQRECVYTVVNEPKGTTNFLHVLFFTIICGRRNYACAEKMCASFRHGQRENMCVLWDPWMHLTD